MPLSKILTLLNKHGSVFCSPKGINKMLVQHLYVSEEKLISLELSPSEQFEELQPKVWFLESIRPRANYTYWIYKNCLKFPNEETQYNERMEHLVPDRYCKNNLPVVSKTGEVFYSQNFVLPITLPKYNYSTTLREEQIKSNILNQTINIVLAFPPNYNPAKRYKCLCVLDGYIWLYTMQLHQHLAHLASAGKSQQYIVCYVMQKDRLKELENNKDYCKFLGQELPAHLVSQKIVASSEDLILYGQSIGGLAALNTERYCPASFGTIISQSASIWCDKSGELGKYFKNNCPICKLYFSLGNCEISLIKNIDIKFKNYLKNKKNCKFRMFSGGHNFISWLEDLLKYLKNINK